MRALQCQTTLKMKQVAHSWCDSNRTSPEGQPHRRPYLSSLKIVCKVSDVIRQNAGRLRSKGETYSRITSCEVLAVVAECISQGGDVQSKNEKERLPTGDHRNRAVVQNKQQGTMVPRSSCTKYRHVLSETQVQNMFYILQQMARAP